MAPVGLGARVGIHPASVWNNPEPELVLVINSAGAIVAVTLGNDVNLRDVEGRSALLLGRAKDNNASCSMGPFFRLLDDAFTLAAARRVTFVTTVDGADGFHVTHTTRVSEIGRDLADLAGQTLSRFHQYPDGLVLFIGTMFTPLDDRGAPGSGFTHKVGDVVSIASPDLGTLVNEVVHCDAAEPWTFGTGALMANLARRGLLRS
jgi:fumarylacetoacetate (FAA) hydrolase family protein